VDIDELEETLSGLPTNHQLAFTAILADRMLGVAKQVVPEEVARAPFLAQALELVWRTIAGEKIPRPQFRELHSKIDKLFPESEDDDEGPGQVIDNTASTVTLALGIIYDPKDAAELAASAGGLAEDVMALAYEDSDKASAAEEKWQAGALKALKKLGDKPATREFFASLKDYDRGPLANQD
jgi:hypothetical protein